MNRLKKFLRDFFAECEKSPTGRHNWEKDSCQYCLLPQESYRRQIPLILPF